MLSEQIVDPLAGRTEITPLQSARLSAATLDHRGTLVFIGNIPCHITDIAFIECFDPLDSFLFIDSAVTARIRDTELRDKNRQSLFDRVRQSLSYPVIGLAAASSTFCDQFGVPTMMMASLSFLRITGITDLAYDLMVFQSVPPFGSLQIS